jgi:hypothetical protein
MMMDWKGFNRKKSQPIVRHYPDIFFEEVRKTMKNLNQDSWSPVPRFEPGTSQI